MWLGHAAFVVWWWTVNTRWATFLILGYSSAVRNRIGFLLKVIAVVQVLFTVSWHASYHVTSCIVPRDIMHRTIWHHRRAKDWVWIPIGIEWVNSGCPEYDTACMNAQCSNGCDSNFFFLRASCLVLYRKRWMSPKTRWKMALRCWTSTWMKACSMEWLPWPDSLTSFHPNQM